MKKLALLLGVMSLIAFTPRFSEEEITNTLIYKTLSKATVSPYTKGEKLSYSIGYGVLGGGVATVEVKDDDLTMNGEEIYHIVGTGKSHRFWDAFYKIRDTYETFIDAKTKQPKYFKRRVNEGGFIIEQDYKFNQAENSVKTEKEKTFEVPTNVQDMMSAFFYARTFDFSAIHPGDIVTVETFVDEEIWPLSIKYIGEETVKVDAGKFSCMKFVPIVQKGRIFKEEEDLLVYISNDNNKIPIKIEAKILFGSVAMELTDYEGLAN